MEKTFTIKNINSLVALNVRINSMLKEHCNGNLMASQLMVLGRLIKEWAEHPIVKNSGIIKAL